MVNVISHAGSLVCTMRPAKYVNSGIVPLPKPPLRLQRQPGAN